MLARHLKVRTLALLLMVCVPLVSQAQSRPTLKTVDQRLQRVERVLDQSMLQQLQRVDSLQAEIRQLRGEIESLNYELEAQKKRNRNLYLDTDKRLTDMESNQFSGGGLDELGGSGGLDELGDPLQSSGQSSAALPPAAVITSSRAANAANSTRPATAAEKSSYTKAYDLLARGQNDAAITAFDKFIEQYSDGPYSDNAWYWQGEAKYAQRNFDGALRNFNVVVGSYPGSPKVPDARLKVGFALYEQQRFTEARQVLTGVQNDYPGRSAAVLARKRLQKMDREGR
jgi:tol-pal system protein YbgF